MAINSKISILLIEDNLGDAHLVKVYLREASIKFDLHHVESFQEAHGIMEEKTIDVVLLDLSLPDSSGFKTLTNFKGIYPNLPVIVMTGINDEIVGNQAIKAGAQDFLVKGEFDGKLLGRVIRYSLQRHKTKLKLEEVARTLAKNEKRFTEAQQMAQFGSWEMDLVNNEMSWTDETYRIFGFSPNSFSPTLSDYMNYIHVEDKDLVDDFFENAAKDGQLHTVEHRIVLGARDVKYVQAHAKVYFEEITNKLLLVGGIQDITERKLSEQLMVEKNLTDQSSKIKEEILEDMGFLIKTPMNSIVQLTYLMETTMLNSQQAEYVGGLKTSVDDLSISVNNLLNFSVLVSEKITLEENEFKIKDFIQSIEKVVSIKANQKNVSIKFELDKNLPLELIGDSNKINQIFYNIIDNAIRYNKTDGKGHVTVAIHSEAQENNHINLVVKINDNGIGMSKEQISEILQPDILTQLQKQEGKKKLGVAIVNKLVTNMEGNMTINSLEGQGTTVSIELPLRMVIKEDAITFGDAPEAPLKILLVEDHFLNQIATKKVLTTWSDFVTVDIAENGFVGVEKQREYGYDLILMDIQMPVMNGLDAAAKIRERSTVPLIALTANSTKQEMDNCFNIGMNGYLAKPFQPKELHKKIMEVMSKVTSTS